MTIETGLGGLERLVGTWRLSGVATGQASYRWMDGGRFLLEELEATHRSGHRITAVEIIGRERPRGADESAGAITSWYFDNLGNTWRYRYEVDGDTVTIFGDGQAEPEEMRLVFGADGDTVTSDDDDGDELTMTRVR